MHGRVALLVAVLALLPSAARAQGPCSYLFENGIRYLQNDCETDHSIVIEDGEIFDGGLHVILAIDTPDLPFEGGVVVARGRWATVRNTRITTALAPETCLQGEARLRGIYFDGACGEIADNAVSFVSRGALECPEGNGIEVRNRYREGPPITVSIRGNLIDRYQKTAIVVHGNVDATIAENAIGSSTAQVIVPNGIQVGPLATAQIERNRIAGRFTGRTDVGSAILLSASGPGTLVDGNTIDGDSDVGIYVDADGVTVTNNVVRDTNPNGLYDVGIVNRGGANRFFNNTVTGFRSRYYGVDPAPPGPRGQQIE